MADWVVTVYYRDADLGTTQKQFAGTFADYATASTAAADLVTDLQAASEAHIYKYTLAEETLVAGVEAGNVFERISATVTLEPDKRWLLYKSDDAGEIPCGGLGGCRNINKKSKEIITLIFML